MVQERAWAQAERWARPGCEAAGALRGGSLRSGCGSTGGPWAQTCPAKAVCREDKPEGSTWGNGGQRSRETSGDSERGVRGRAVDGMN